MKDWLWDRKVNISEVKSILKNPNSREFVVFASLLLARKNNPREVFKEYLDPLLFCRHWQKIKGRMRKDKWNHERIIFWQEIYNKLKNRYRTQGIVFREKKGEVKGVICEKAGKMIRDIRKEEGLSQKALADKLGVSQQLISRIENGKENISLITLDNILRALGRELKITYA